MDQHQCQCCLRNQQTRHIKKQQKTLKQKLDLFFVLSHSWIWIFLPFRFLLMHTLMFVDCRLPKGAGTTVAWQIRYRLTSEYPPPGQTTTVLFPSGHQTFLLYLHVVFLRWSVRDLNLMCHTLVGVSQNSGRSEFCLVWAADSPLSLFLRNSSLTIKEYLFIKFLIIFPKLPGTTLC